MKKCSQEMQTNGTVKTMKTFSGDLLEHGQREPLCIECKLNCFIKVQTKVKRLHQMRRSISEIIKIMQ